MLRTILIILTLCFSQVSYAKTTHFETMLGKWVDSYHFKLTRHDRNAIIKAAVKYSSVHGVNPVLTLSVLNVESSFRKDALSPTGPKCLMQVATSVHKDKIKGRNIYELNTCLDVGVAVIKWCARNNRGIDATLKCYSGYDGDRLKTYQRLVKSRYDDFRRLAQVNIRTKRS